MANTAIRDAIAYADHLRETIRHENDLVNHRINWLSILNGLAITALGNLWEKPGVYWIIVIMAGCGIASSWSCFIALHGGRMALIHLNRLWAMKEKELEEQGVDTVSLIAPISARAGRNRGIKSSPSFRASRESSRKDFYRWVDGPLAGWFHPFNFIPMVLVTAWISIICVATAQKQAKEKKERAAVEAPAK